jgi:hypothetical protein
VHDLGDVGVKEVPVRSVGNRSGSDCTTADLRLARPLRLGTLDRVDRGAVQGEPRIPTQIRTLARVDLRDPATTLYDMAVALPPGDPEPYITAGATWWKPDFPPEITLDRVQGVLHDGPYKTRTATNEYVCFYPRRG